jgi:hypothetical protein
MPKRLHKKVSIAHSGVYSYLKEELPTLGLSMDSIPEMFKNETHFNVYRPATVLAKAAPLFAKQPVTVEHPDRLLNPQNVMDHMEGFTGDTVRVAYRNGEAYLDSTLTLIAEDAIRYYEEGYKEVSPGYITQARWVSDSMVYKGMPVHIVVTGISEVNHLALTVAGRGGPTACVLDSKGDSMFLTDLFKAAKNLFTKDSIETVHSLLAEVCKAEITAERVGEIIDKVVTLSTVFIESEDKRELLRYLDDLRFAAELNKEEVQAAVNTVLSLYDKLDTAAKAEINNTKEKSMLEKTDPVAEPVKDTDPAAGPVKDTEPVKDAEPKKDPEPTTDYAPGATGVAGPGSQKMVSDGGFIQELKALIAKYEGTTDAKPPVPDAPPEPVKDTEPKKDPEPKAAEPTKDSAPVEPVTATLDSTGSTSGGIDEFMKDFRK